jgi:hypothetical protein
MSEKKLDNIEHINNLPAARCSRWASSRTALVSASVAGGGAGNVETSSSQPLA